MRIQPNTSKLGETALAVADYAFDEPLFMTYRIVRNAHQMRFYGWCSFLSLAFYWTLLVSTWCLISV